MEFTALHIKEYEKLQKEITDSMAEISALEKYAVAATGAIFTWLLTCEQPVPLIAYFLPAIMVLLFGWLTYGLFERMNLISTYLQRYEKRMNEGVFPELGWETFLTGALKPGGSNLARSRKWMWIIHLVLNLGIGGCLAWG